MLLPTPAHAASPSLGWFGSGGSSGLGRWQVGSTIVYCVDPLYGSESGANGSSYFLGVGDWLNHYGSPHHLTATEIARINWAIHSYGMLPGSGSDAKRWAAAVQMYIWSITAPEVYANPGAYAGTGSGNGDSWFSARILLHGGTTADRTGVLDRLATLRDKDAAISAAVPSLGGSISIGDAADADDASFIVSATSVPAGVSYTVTLTNARFTDGSSTRSFSGPASVAVDAQPPFTAASSGYTITAKLGYSRSYWSDRIKLWKPVGGQRVATGIQLERSYATTGALAIGADIALFAPELVTAAPRFVDVGESFDDVVTLSAAATGETGPWVSDAEGYLPVTARGTLYGPFAAPPVDADAPPVEAPVAAVVTITTDPVRGPDDYRVRDDGALVSGDLTAAASGYYSWVWEIDAASQQDRVAERLPSGYAVRDRFGLAAETSIVPFAIHASTRVTASEVPLSGAVQDVLSVGDDGLWLEVDGGPIPLTFRGTAYFVAGDTPPAESGVIPDSAVELGTTFLTVTGPGDYTSRPGDILAPDEGDGFIVWRWALLPDDQPDELRGYTADWADLFGIATETQRLLRPAIRTQAQAEAAIGDGFTDTAIITGALPANGALLSFELYSAAAGEHAAPIWESEPIHVTEAGEYRSPAAPGQLAGRYHWIERLDSVEDHDHDGERLIARGEWGLAEETTQVVAPTVTTSARAGAERVELLPGAGDGEGGSPALVQAQPGVEATGGIHDTATVAGAIPAAGAELRFEAYRVPTAAAAAWPGGPLAVDTPEGRSAGDLSWVCTPENLVFTSSVQHVAGPGVYSSEEYAAAEYGLYLWTEILSVDLGDGPVDIHRGACGVAEETSVILDVETVAQSDDPSGTDPTPELWDTAELTGWVPEGARLRFDAYRGSVNAAPACTAETRVYGSGEFALASGLYLPDAPLVVTGPSWEAPVNRLAHTRVYWVQSLVDGLGRVVSVGECGDPAETTRIPAPPLTATGITVPLLALGGAASALVAVGVLVLLIRRRHIS